MPTRRNTLKTIAAGTVVGSLSGCVQLATRRTSHFRGTPAMFTSSSGSDWNGGNPTTAVGVGVEARKSIERFGVEKEIVAHSWGMLYASTDIGLESESDPQVGSLAVVTTFTTPSITVASQELNPIAELTVGKIAGEFATTAVSAVQAGTNGDQAEGGSALWARGRGSRVNTTVKDATGKKVLRAFRDAVGSPGAAYEPPSLDASASGGTLSTVPDWDGEGHEFNISIPDEEAEDISGALRFDKHDGDFVVVFGVGGDSATQVLETVSTAEIGQKTAPWTVRPDPPQASDPTIIHPNDDQFSLDQLELHLLDTNLRGAQGMVSRARKLIDETKGLLAEIDGEAVGSDTLRAISDTRDDVKRLDTIMEELEADLQTFYGEGSFSGNPLLDRVRERSKKAAAIAAEAHERIASYNDTRDEEDDRFVTIEQNLSGIKRLVNTVGEAIEYLEKNAQDD